MILKIISKGVIFGVLYDKEDQNFIDMYNWCIRDKGNGRYYVAANDYSGEKIRSVFVHRLIMGVIDAKLVVDHKDHNPLNNRRSNLRICTHAQNMKNLKLYKSNSTGFKGVFFDPVKKLYRVMLRCDGKKVSGGRHKDIIKAAKKYNELAILHHGEFAFLNKIPE